MKTKVQKIFVIVFQWEELSILTWVTMEHMKAHERWRPLFRRRKLNRPQWVYGDSRKNSTAKSRFPHTQGSKILKETGTSKLLLSLCSFKFSAGSSLLSNNWDAG